MKSLDAIQHAWIDETWRVSAWHAERTPEVSGLVSELQEKLGVNVGHKGKSFKELLIELKEAMKTGLQHRL